MYKSKLQELCQQRGWGLPDYHTSRDGPDHMSRFAATVSVCGQVFYTPPTCRSSKDAQNTVARIAFDHFINSPPQPPTTSSPPAAIGEPISAVAISKPVSPVVSLPAHPVSPLAEMEQVSQNPPLPESPLPSALPLPPLGLLTPKNDANSKPGEVVQRNCEDNKGTSAVYKIAVGSYDMSYKETLHMYKNRLQHYAQRQNLCFPVYTCESEGPPHARRFKSRVSLNGKSYETVEFFPTLKEAEQAAAKVACQVLSVDGIQEDVGLYKNLLQDFAQKKGLTRPSYETTTSGMSHMPVFVSTVEIGSYVFRGAEARTKKQAEMNVAKVAYRALTEGYPAMESSGLSSPAVAEPISTPKKHHAEDKEAQIQSKKAKPSPENVNACLSGSSNPPPNPSSLLSSQMGNRSSSEPVVGQSVVYPPSQKLRIIVMPRNSDLPRPEGAEVLPYSDDQWVAYRLEPTKESIA